MPKVKGQIDGQYNLDEYRIPEARIKMCAGPDTIFSPEPIDSPGKAAQIIGDHLLKDADREYLIATSLDNKLHPINYSVVSIGTANASFADPKEIFKNLILSNATAFMLMHNHPAGDPSPSAEDFAVTKKLADAGSTLDIPLVDHVVYGSGTGKYYSFKENGHLPEQESQLNAAESTAQYKAEKGTVPSGEHQEAKKPKSVDEAIQQIKGGISKCASSEEWKNILDVFSRFHAYSLNNCLLIHLQNPSSTQVASYTTWKSLNRHVMAGQKGMKIICPAPYRKKEEQEIIDEKTGEKKKEMVEVQRMAFTLGTVFDVSQTDGEPLPEITHELQGDLSDKDLFEAAKRSAPVGISVEIGSVDGSAKGYYSPSEREIRVREGMSEVQQLKTLAHELGHAYAEATYTDKDQFSTPDKELQAESIAYIVCQHYGIDSGEQYSFPYLTGWSGGDAERIMPNLAVIKKCSADIIRSIDRNLEQMRTEKATEGSYKTEYGWIDLQRGDDGTWAYKAYNKNYKPMYSGQTEQHDLRIDQAVRQINMQHGYTGISQSVNRQEMQRNVKLEEAEAHHLHM